MLVSAPMLIVGSMLIVVGSLLPFNQIFPFQLDAMTSTDRLTLINALFDHPGVGWELFAPHPRDPFVDFTPELSSRRGIDIASGQIVLVLGFVSTGASILSALAFRYSRALLVALLVLPLVLAAHLIEITFDLMEFADSVTFVSPQLTDMIGVGIYLSAIGAAMVALGAVVGLVTITGASRSTAQFSELQGHNETAEVQPAQTASSAVRAGETDSPHLMSGSFGNSRLMTSQGVPESPLEDAFIARLRDSIRVEVPLIPQVLLEASGQYYRVDFAWLEQKLVVELDGSQHLDPVHADADRRRDADLRSIGYRVLRFTWNDVHKRWSDVERQLLDAGGAVKAGPGETDLLSDSDEQPARHR